jgi:hypothetical protein
MLACHLIRASEDAKVAGYICGLVVSRTPASLGITPSFRFIETVLGVAIAWAISYVPKLIRTEQLDR